MLDTNAFIQLWQRQNLNVRHRFAAHSLIDIALCSVVKVELLYGAWRSQRIAKNLHLLSQLFAPLQSLPFDDVAAERYVVTL